MPFTMKIQPIDFNTPEGSFRNDPVKPVAKSRFKRLFERQFPNVLKITSAEKPGISESQCNKDGNGDFEPSSVCLAKMVQSFIEENNEKQTASSKYGRNHCNCFNGNYSDSSDDELDEYSGFGESITTCSSCGACEILKSIVSCVSVAERNLLADTAKIVEMNKNCNRKDDCRKIVTEGLSFLGYDASICKSRWEKSRSYPSGEYEYIDVITERERLLIDIDFKSEFEIARSTKNYRAVLHSLPSVFVGKADRLQQIISIVSEAAKQSLKKKDMHFPPWRKAEYMRAKWLSPYTRTTIKPTESETEIVNKSFLVTTEHFSGGTLVTNQLTETETETETEIENKSCLVKTEHFSDESGLIFEEKTSTVESVSGESASLPAENSGEEKIKVIVSPWQLPAIKPKSYQSGAKIVTGLASVLKET